jgi:hypothetical protein
MAWSDSPYDADYLQSNSFLVPVGVRGRLLSIVMHHAYRGIARGIATHGRERPGDCHFECMSTVATRAKCPASRFTTCNLASSAPYCQTPSLYRLAPG